MQKKLKLIIVDSLTFEQGFNEFLNSCKARNLREGTFKHLKSITRFISTDASIKDFSQNTINKFVMDCLENNTMNSQTLYTYARDLKTMFYFFMRIDRE